MKKTKKILVQMITFIVILLLGGQVFATSNIEWAMIDETVQTKTTVVKNPLKLTRMLGTTVQSRYSLKDIIPENMLIKDQADLDISWAFSSIAVLESNLALKDYKAGIAPRVYDFSERHMDYSTSTVFADGGNNIYGFNRTAGVVGIMGMPISYFTNGMGAISEDEMKFQTTADLINLSEIQNKNVITQVNDIVRFSSSSDRTELKQRMKEHLMNKGAINATIYWRTTTTESSYFNNETGAYYCNDSESQYMNHYVAIIGWDDNYAIENFAEGNQPSSKGAWIVKNSKGTDIGDNGFLYVSYEDVNIYNQLIAIEDAQYGKTYENLYQYDELGGYYRITGKMQTAYLAAEFDRQTSGVEYLTQISLQAPETYTCKVFVNPNGTSKAVEDLQQVDLKSGETETISSGYHTIEFANPIEINGDSFAVVVEATGTRETIGVTTEMIYRDHFPDAENVNDDQHFYNTATISDGKCFLANETQFQNNTWIVTPNFNEISGGNLPDCDLTIKAFTTSKVLQGIEITKQPTKTSYIVGQNFDPTGMVVKANYANGESIEITDYTVLNGSELALGQSTVTIAYNGFTTEQAISVEENSMESIEIKTPPAKTEYWAGEDFDATGMEVEVICKDGSRDIITEYTVKDGQALKNGQTTVTIEYEGLTTTQEITVRNNELEKIEITKAPNKVNYIARQDFDATGMVVKATYSDGTSREVTDYIIKDGKDLYVGQTTVTIEYEGLTATQKITVVEKSVVSISIKQMPSKTEYIQNEEELDLNGGSINVVYNDDTIEEISMISSDITVTGFDNSEAGTQTITLTYEGKTVQFEIEVKEQAKPQNSNFDRMQGDVTRIRAYYFTDNQNEYTIIDVELSDIEKATVNEKIEYYYYLSSNPNEVNIADWVKIDEIEEVNGKMKFEINTQDVSNENELSEATNLYLYIKEVATRNNMKAEKITSALTLDVDNITVEEYVDGEKKDDVDSDDIINPTPDDKEEDDETQKDEEKDDTVAQERIPYAGKGILVIILAVIMIVIGRIAYLKYKEI